MKNIKTKSGEYNKTAITQLRCELTVEILRSYGACEVGIRRFSKVFPDGFDGDWCATTQALVLGTELRKYIGYAWNKGWVPQWSMDAWNLCGADLDGAILDGANLDGASLVGANLVGANLVEARLYRANLDGAILDGAILDGARLDGARLDGANLVGASLVGARLYRASLVGASLRGANLDGANLVGAGLDGANLVGAFWGVDLEWPYGYGWEVDNYGYLRKMGSV